jgi:hypothetical protein
VRVPRFEVGVSWFAVGIKKIVVRTTQKTVRTPPESVRRISYKEKEMSDEVTAVETEAAVPPVSAGTVKKPRATPADQDREIQNFITQEKERIIATKQDPLLLAELLRLGVDEAFLTTGEDLVLSAQDAFTLRQQAIGRRDAANNAVERAHTLVLTRYTDFREVVRLAFPDAPSRRALSTTGAVPRDKQKLVTQMRASLATAQTAPYAAELSRRSYNAAGCATATAEVDALDQALATRTAVLQQAVASTATRDAIYKQLRTWSSTFHRALKRAKARRG